MGLPKFCKKYGNGVFVVAANNRFYTTTVTRSEGEGKQSVCYLSLNRSNRCDLNENNNISIYNNLLNPEFI